MVFLFKERYINLLTAFGFKRVFGTEANKQFTLDFLNTLLPPHHQIQDLSFKNNESLGLTVLDRRAVFDVFCQGSNGEQFIVEMQRIRQAFFKDRSLFYATFPIQEQSTRDDWDYCLSSVYTISVLDFVMMQQEKNPNFIHHIELKDDNGDRFYDKLAFIYIELPKFTKALEQLNIHDDKWFYLFRHLPELTDQPEIIHEPIFDELFEVAKIANFSPEEQDIYQSILKAYRDFNNVMTTAIQEAEAKADQKGMERERSRFLTQQQSLLLRLLSRQLGQLPDNLSGQIRQLSLDNLDVLANAFPDFNDIHDLQRWLDQYPAT